MNKVDLPWKWAKLRDRVKNVFQLEEMYTYVMRYIN